MVSLHVKSLLNLSQYEIRITKMLGRLRKKSKFFVPKLKFFIEKSLTTTRFCSWLVEVKESLLLYLSI